MLARGTSAPLINTSLTKGAAQTVSKTGRSNSVSFRGWLDMPSKHTATLKELCERWQDTGLFPDVCGPTKRRELTYPVYADPFGPLDLPNLSLGSDETQLNYAFEMERSACARGCIRCSHEHI